MGRERDITKRPEPDKAEGAHRAAKAGLSIVPVIGGALSEVFDAVIISPLSNRRDTWVEDIGKMLLELKEKVEETSFEKLTEDEVFLSTVMQASQIAMKTHHEEKKKALISALKNTALNNYPDEDTQMIFMNLIDTFTTWHIIILKFLEDPKAFGESRGIEYPNWTMGGPATVLEHSIPDLEGKRKFYEKIVNDLSAEGLLLKGDFLFVTMSAPGMFEKRTSELGRQFLDFISEEK